MKSNALRLLLCWVVLLGGWEIAYRAIQWDPWIFPAPSHVANSLLQLLSVPWSIPDVTKNASAAAVSAKKAVPFWRSDLVTALVVSLIRLTVGFVLSVILGLTLGALLWRSRFLDALLGPPLLGLQTLPSVCWVPLAVLLFGITETGMMFVLVMGSVFSIAISLRDGLRAIPPIYKNAGLMLGAHRWRLYWYVLFPAGLPALAGSLRQGFSFAWRSLMGGELILMASNRGLGFLLQAGREFNDIAQVVAMMAMMVAIGMIADRLVFARVEHRVRERFGLA